MINNMYVEILAIKIFIKEINPNTNNEFKIDDIKKEEYKQPILDKIKELEKERLFNDQVGQV
ncbi:MAG: hypothetical protein ACRC68_11320 [Clostridium sp.]